MARLSLRLLGPFQASLDGEAVSGFRSDKVRGLLAYLCVERHRPWSRATLADLLWADFPAANASSNLRNALSNLRRVLADQQADRPFLHVSRATVQFNADSDCWIDAHALLDLLPEADQAEHAFSYQEDLHRLDEALDLYRGEFLESLAVASAPFDDWVLTTGEHIRHRVLRATRLLALGYAQLGDLAASTKVTRRWLELGPWDEEAHRHMMRLLALRGQRGAALAHYQACQRTLSDELGVEPDTETGQLYEQIHVGSFDTSPAGLPVAIWPLGKRFSFEARVRPGVPEFGSKVTSDAPEGTLFVDRKEELAALAGALSRATAGRGGVRLVTGEPGSGKTALLAEFSRRALARHRQLLVASGQCNAFTGQGDPYFPFLTIARTLSGEVDAPASTMAIGRDCDQRGWQCLPATVDALLDHAPDLIDRFVSGADLLARARLHGGVKSAQLARLQSLLDPIAQQPPERRVRQVALFEQFTRFLSTLAQRWPLVLIVDDMQWIDPGSVELLFHVARHIAGRRILLLGAYRPQDPSLHRGEEPHPLLGVIGELQRDLGDIHVDLMQSDGSAFVAALIDSEPNRLGGEFRDLLHRHTSGNPLFTIELLRAMQLRGELLRNPEGQWVEGPHLNWDELPARVEAVIGRRIHHLSPACQELLRTGSIEGDQFTAQVVADLRQKDVQHVCEVLSQEASREHRVVTAQTVRQINGRTLARYRFRHALFRIYLYQQLDTVERARLHGLVAQALERLYLGSIDQFPEIVHALARHFESAGRVEEAVGYNTQAGKHALRLSANREALAHFYQALALLKDLPHTPERDRQELDLQLSLGPPLTATKGWAPPEMATAYARAEQLLETIDDHAQLIPALWLLATYRLGRSEHAQVDRLVERMYRLVQQADDPALLALANLQASPFYQGKFSQAARILKRATAAPDLEQQRQLALQYGMAPAVVGLGYLAVCLWVVGLPDAADHRVDQARDLAERVGHPMSTCYALSRFCWLAALRGELERVRREAAALNATAQEFRFENFVIGARFFTHWAAVQGEDPDGERICPMKQAVDEYRATGTVLNRTGFLTLFAEACATAGEIPRGLAAVNESLAVAERTGELWFQAETLRVKGELLHLQAAQQAQPAEALSAAEDCFQNARQLAEQQGAKSFELRAAVSLYLLWEGQSRENQGRDILLRILDRFDDGLDTIDIRRAKALLRRL